MVVWRLQDSDFWRERPGTVDPELVRGQPGRKP
jgi:hypothetical protein